MGRKCALLFLCIILFFFFCGCRGNSVGDSSSDEEPLALQPFLPEEVAKGYSLSLDYSEKWTFYAKPDGTSCQLLCIHKDEEDGHEEVLDTLNSLHFPFNEGSIGLTPFENIMESDGFVFKYESEEGSITFDFYRVEGDNVAKIITCKGDMYLSDLDNDGMAEVICSNGVPGSFNLFWQDEEKLVHECNLNEATRIFFGLQSSSQLSLNIPTGRASIMTFFPDRAELRFENVDLASVYIHEKDSYR